MTLYPVILAGDRRTDSWPLSREAHPPRFLPIVEGRSPFQAMLKGAVRALDPEALEGCHAASFDRAVLERTRLAAMVPARFGWSDGGLQDIEVLAGAHPGEDDIVRVADAHPHTPQGA